MARLETQARWVRFAPDIGNNRELAAGEQLLLEVQAGLTREEMLAFAADIKAAGDGQDDKSEAIVAVLARHVRLVGANHRIGGRDINNVGDYAKLCNDIPDQLNMRELFGCVAHFNSLAGGEALFSERRSGGTAFTPPRRAASQSNEG
jgi:hypothetical protein